MMKAAAQAVFRAAPIHIRPDAAITWPTGVAIAKRAPVINVTSRTFHSDTRPGLYSPMIDAVPGLVGARAVCR